MGACKKMRAADLREKITIRKRTETETARGTFTDTYQDYEVFANVKPLGGREVYEQMRVRPGEAFKITIRFRGDANRNPFFTNDDVVLLRTMELAVESVVDVDDRHQWIELRCKLNKAT